MARPSIQPWCSSSSFSAVGGTGRRRRRGQVSINKKFQMDGKELCVGGWGIDHYGGKTVVVVSSLVAATLLDRSMDRSMVRGNIKDYVAASLEKPLNSATKTNNSVQ